MFLSNLPILDDWDWDDKKKVSHLLQTQMLLKLTKVFHYDNLPESIPADVMDMMLMQSEPAAVIIMPHDGQLYVYNGGFSEFPDVYYRPTAFTIANVAQNISGTFTFGKDCVLMQNDSMCEGVRLLNAYYANLLTDAIVTLRMTLINHRAMIVIDAVDDKVAKAANKFFDDLAAGKLSAITSGKQSSFLEGLKALPYSTASGSAIIKEAIEAVQYIYGQWYMALGLKSAFNIKREAINSAESDMSDSILLPGIDNMKECRQKAFDEAYEMWPELFPNGPVVVSLESSWEDIQNMTDEAIDGEEEENPENGENSTEGHEETQEDNEKEDEEKEDEEDDAEKSDK